MAAGLGSGKRLVRNEIMSCGAATTNQDTPGCKRDWGPADTKFMNVGCGLVICDRKLLWLVALNEFLLNIIVVGRNCRKKEGQNTNRGQQAGHTEATIFRNASNRREWVS